MPDNVRYGSNEPVSPNPNIPNPGEDTFMWRLVHLNPVIWKGVIVAVIAALAAFGVHLSPAIPDALDGLIAAVAVLAQTLWVRPSVTPNAQVVALLPDPVNAPGAIVAGDAVTTAPDHAVVAAAREAGKPTDAA